MSKRNRTNVRKEPAKKSKPAASKPKSVSSPENRIPELDDKCLEKTFSYLSPIDLCVVKEASRRFAQLADHQFQKSFGNKEFVFSPKPTKEFVANVVPPKFWSMFGKFIRNLSVHMNNGADAAQHWKGICENCTDLKELKVFFCDLKLFQPQTFSAKDLELDSLHVACFFGKDEDYTRIIGYFGNFERLSVQNIQNTAVRCEFLRRNYPRLKEIVFESVEADDNFDELIRLNPQIEKIFAHNCLLAYDRVDAITKYCPNITELSIQCDESSENYSEKIARLSRFAALKKLQFNCLDDVQGIIDAIKVLAGMNSIEELGLTGGRLNVDLCRELVKMKSLKTLKLVQFEDVTASLLKKLVSDLKLAHVHIIWCDEVKYKDIAVAIKSSRTLKSVTFEFYEDFILDNKAFSQLVSARTASGASSPLEFFHIKYPRSPSNQITAGKQQMQECAAIIQLKKREGLFGYITNPVE